jgi:hypothetical protein
MDRVNVYNFGNGAFRSWQERVRFEQLLMEGHAPDMAVFVDGLNEFVFSEPGYRKRLQMIFDQPAEFTSDFGRLLKSFSLVKLLQALSVRLSTVIRPESPEIVDSQTAVDDAARIRNVVDGYLRGQQMTKVLARGYSVIPVFVWQPVPSYHYDLNQHLFATENTFAVGINRHVRRGYSYFAEYLLRRPRDPQFIWCADIQELIAEPLYIDHVHYTARMSRRFARAFGRAILARHLVPGGLIRHKVENLEHCSVDD